MAHRGATYTNDQVREFLQVGAHFELAKHAVGRRRSKHWVPAELARPTLRESCPTVPPRIHRQAIGLSQHIEAFSEGYGVDGAHLKMIMEHADSASVLC